MTPRVAFAVLLLLGAPLLAACRADAAPPGEVVVTMEHSRFVPDSIELRAGQTVTFVVRNTDPIDHEFILGDEVTQEVHEQGTHAQHGDVPGEVSVPAGEERTTTYTFTAPGTLIIGCHLPGHYDYGMRAEVMVRP